LWRRSAGFGCQWLCKLYTTSCRLDQGAWTINDELCESRWSSPRCVCSSKLTVVSSYFHDLVQIGYEMCEVYNKLFSHGTFKLSAASVPTTSQLCLTTGYQHLHRPCHLLIWTRIPSHHHFHQFLDRPVTGFVRSSGWTREGEKEVLKKRMGCWQVRSISCHDLNQVHYLHFFSSPTLTPPPNGLESLNTT